MRYEFTVPGPPVPWARVKRSRTGHAYVPKTTELYKRKVQMCARTAGVRELTGDIYLQVWIYVANKRRCDGDNFQKSIQDALNGISYRDDSQIKEWRGSIALDSENPRVLVRVEEISK